MANLIPFKQRVKDILRERGITILQFCEDTGISRENFFYRKTQHKHCKYIHMAIAYYLNMTVEELVKGTDAEDVWYY